MKCLESFKLNKGLYIHLMFQRNLSDLKNSLAVVQMTL